MAKARTNPWLVLLVLTTGFFMIMLDTTIVNVAIPAMSAGLNTTLDQILWVLNAYILVYAVLLITAGRLGDLYGQRNLFAIGLVIFTVASALCGLSQNAGELIAARILQGVGGALLTPQTLAIITSLFPPERRGAAFGIWGAVAGLATVAGPTIGGAIVTYIDWRWIFFVNVPIGIAALVATFVIIPDLRPGRRHGWDVVGVILSTAGLFGIVFGLIEGERYNWGEIASYGVTIPEIIVGGAVLVVVFIIWERFQAEPLVPLSLFEERNFAVANWIAASIAFGMMSLFLPIVIYLQSVRGFSALTAGLTLAPMSVTSMVVAPFAGRMADRIGGKYILTAGILAVHHRCWFLGVRRRARLNLAYLPSSCDHRRRRHGHDVRTDDDSRDAQHLAARGRSGLRRAEHHAPARRGDWKRGGRRHPAEPPGNDPARPGGQPRGLTPCGFQSSVCRRVQLGGLQRLRDRHRAERRQAASRAAARGSAADQRARSRRFRQRLHRRHEINPGRAYRLPRLYRADHAPDQEKARCPARPLSRDEVRAAAG